MAFRVQIRRGTASEWSASNPILLDGEFAIEKDTRKFKIGDGVTNWNGLLYATQGELGKSIQYVWDGTRLGIRQEGDSNYQYMDLQGKQGKQGDKGDTGSVDNLNSTHITTALGYTPANATNEHTHNNKTVIDKFTEVSGKPYYNGNEIGGGTVPTKTSELENDSGFITSSEIPTSLPANGGNADTVGGFTVGVSVPANAKFTDTIPDTSTLMPKSGGVLENYREKLTTVSASGATINLSLGNVFQHSPSGNTTYTITNAVSGQAHSFTLIITQTATVRTLTFPASVKWQGGEIPDLSSASKTYVLTFMTVNGGTTWLGMFGGEF